MSVYFLKEIIFEHRIVLNFSLQDIIVILSVLVAGKDTNGQIYPRD